MIELLLTQDTEDRVLWDRTDVCGFIPAGVDSRCGEQVHALLELGYGSKGDAHGHCKRKTCTDEPVVAPLCGKHLPIVQGWTNARMTIPVLMEV